MRAGGPPVALLLTSKSLVQGADCNFVVQGCGHACLGNGLELCELNSAAHSSYGDLCAALFSSHNSKPFPRYACPQLRPPPGGHRTAWRRSSCRCRPAVHVRREWQIMSRPAGHDQPTSSHGSCGHWSHLHGPRSRVMSRDHRPSGCAVGEPRPSRRRAGFTTTNIRQNQMNPAHPRLSHDAYSLY